MLQQQTVLVCPRCGTCSEQKIHQLRAVVEPIITMAGIAPWACNEDDHDRDNPSNEFCMTSVLMIIVYVMCGTAGALAPFFWYKAHQTRQGEIDELGREIQFGAAYPADASQSINATTDSRPPSCNHWLAATQAGGFALLAVPKGVEHSARVAELPFDRVTMSMKAVNNFHSHLQKREQSIMSSGELVRAAPCNSPHVFRCAGNAACVTNQTGHPLYATLVKRRQSFLAIRELKFG